MAGSSVPEHAHESPSLRPRRSEDAHYHEDAHLTQTSSIDTIDEKAHNLALPLDTHHIAASRDSLATDPARSPLHTRAQTSRLDDDLELLRAERLVSRQDQEEANSKDKKRVPNVEPEDAFNQALHDNQPEKRVDTSATLYKVWVFLLKFPRFIRYSVYLFPGATILLIPVLLGYYIWNNGENAIGGPGGVPVMWFGIWLEIVWGSLWASRMITSLMPPTFQATARMVGSTTPKKWRDIGAQLELHTAVFLWWLAILISYQPTIDNKRAPNPEGGDVDRDWVDILENVIIALFVLATLNFAEKLLIQWIATSFHQRTYATRIDNNKADIGQLVHLYEYAKSHLEESDPFWQSSGNGSPSGTATPMRALQENARQVWGKVGLVANKVGNDIIGRKVSANHPARIVTELLRNSRSAMTLARLIYRSVVRKDEELVYPTDMQVAFNTEAEAEAAFGVFDKDLNGDISLEEFEAVCNEIHLEKKAIAASLKDLDSVIQKLDRVFVVIIVIIAAIVFIAIFSASSAAALASAGSAILGLAWMLQATAQEFLQSIIFVFVKHPFDVGDRITVYGATGVNLSGDDYYVTEISLLYTEFKKMEGHIVQAPNSLLNTLFILNQRRSNGLADVISLKIRFGTPSWMIEELKQRMLNFIEEYKRDYQSNIISEMTGVEECRATGINIIFFHKSSFQNELLRLTRHNRFVVELQQQMIQVGIQAPIRIEPGGSREHPMYWAGMAPPPAYNSNSRDVQHAQERDHYAVPRSSDDYYNAPPPTSSSGGGASLRHTTSVSSTRGGDRNMPGIQATMNDFQDVFEQRKDIVQSQRLASIREKETASNQETESEGRASTSGAAPAASTDSVQQRSRIFGRPRSKSKTQADIV